MKLGALLPGWNRSKFEGNVVNLMKLYHTSYVTPTQGVYLISVVSISADRQHP
jgi:hypothetical protein